MAIIMLWVIEKTKTSTVKEELVTSPFKRLVSSGVQKFVNREGPNEWGFGVLWLAISSMETIWMCM
ncbi:hypothetical protein DVH05_007351 [Phytophthora capsici]|nr:hypothetical protein DVH05_007351 [Phytophthora capsici]